MHGDHVVDDHDDDVALVDKEKRGEREAGVRSCQLRFELIESCVTMLLTQALQYDLCALSSSNVSFLRRTHPAREGGHR